MRSTLFSVAAALPLAAHALDPNNFYEGPGVVRFPLTGNKDALEKHMRRQFEAGLDNRKTGFFYTIDLQIGTPPSTVAVNFDTGSAELWVNPNCAKSNDEAYCKTFGAFGQSSSFVSLQQNTTLKYGRGFANIEYGYDYVTVGTSKINQQTFGVAHDSEFATTGIMGVGPNLRSWDSSYPYVLDNLFKQKFINSRAFSLDIRQVTSARGAAVFGGIDTKKFKGPLVKKDIIPASSSPDGKVRYWANCDGIVINREDGTKVTVLSQPQAFLFDSGYTISALPTTLFTQLLTAFPSAVKEPTGQYTVDCGVVALKGTLDFKFGNATVSVPYSDFIWQQPDYNSCVLGAIEDNAMPVLGDTFLRAAYVVYDWDNRALHFAAAADCGSNLVAIGSGPGAVGVTEGECDKPTTTSSTSSVPTSTTASTTSVSTSTTASTTTSVPTSTTASTTTSSTSTTSVPTSTTASTTASSTSSTTVPTSTTTSTATDSTSTTTSTSTTSVPTSTTTSSTTDSTSTTTSATTSVPTSTTVSTTTNSTSTTSTSSIPTSTSTSVTSVPTSSSTSSVTTGSSTTSASTTLTSSTVSSTVSSTSSVGSSSVATSSASSSVVGSSSAATSSVATSSVATSSVGSSSVTTSSVGTSSVGTSSVATSSVATSSVGASSGAPVTTSTGFPTLTLTSSISPISSGTGVSSNRPTTTGPQSNGSLNGTTYTSIVKSTRTHTITSCAPTVTNCPVGKVTTEVITSYTTWCPEDNKTKSAGTSSAASGSTVASTSTASTSTASTSAYTKPPCPEVTLTFAIPETYYCTKGQAGCTVGEAIVTSHPVTVVPITPLATPTPIPGCVDCHPKQPSKPAETPAAVPAGVVPVAVIPQPVETKEQVPAQSTPAPAPTKSVQLSTVVSVKPSSTGSSAATKPVQPSTLVSAKPSGTGSPAPSQSPIAAGAAGLYVPGLAALIAALVAVM